MAKTATAFTAEELKQTIQQDTEGTIRKLTVVIDLGSKTITISGETTTYYNKQLAQIGILSGYPDFTVINSIIVNW